MELLFKGIVIGIGATVLMDLWAILLWKGFGQSRPNWAPVGRWFGHLPKGTVFHDNIARSAEIPNENAIGWIGHYAVGILYGVILAFLMGPGWFADPTFLPAWIWAILTVAAGWFLLQPGLGLGWAAAKTPSPNKVRLFNLLAHTVFGLGLFGTALLIA